ncbi:hypothetical protein [Cellulomonas xiejunii]|uniref:Uncharacterized protein n=1 Tax=Cellulomonas xiejunii TaxID=2968083 RepID=A0ABY5KN67_9CELL|nr:hypothetical protein [Cellulomonas xiejunii]MCC2313650.1 hypothetical protein [Cellulomonas xiejunii]MCC2321138.1 hypothetical protein [Cellulomonas xiejunii]UUI71729.1 hypothetical protein NP048_18385 [Cellulomonas xiejunii]
MDESPDDTDGLLDDAIGGRFSSWTTPSETDVAGIASRLAEGALGRRRA